MEKSAANDACLPSWNGPWNSVYQEYHRSMIVNFTVKFTPCLQPAIKFYSYWRYIYMHFTSVIYMSCVAQKVALGYFLLKCSFSCFLNVHYVKTNLWKLEYKNFWNKLSIVSKTWCICSAFFAASVTSWYIHVLNVIQAFYFCYLYINIKCIAQWLSENNFDYTVLMFLHNIKIFVNKKTLLWKYMYVLFTSYIWRHFSVMA